jgi:hypothetical protein
MLYIARAKSMSKFILAGLLFVFVLVGSAYAGTDEADGFNDLKWGTPFSQVKDEMTYVCTSPAYGGIRFYTRKNDDLKIGTVRVQYINYGFWHDRFFTVIAVVPNHNNYDALKEVMFQRFGEGQELKQTSEFYTWTGKRTNIVVEYNHRFKGLGCLMVFSAEILNNDIKVLARGN